MIQYIYFVKCPECEDEHFDFFEDAKSFALNCLDRKPIITQTEVNRNDFGECVDSCDLGTIWSWEDLMGNIEEEPLSTFSKYETVKLDMDNDPEFEALDNSLETGIPIPEGMTVEELLEELEENEDTVECKWCDELFDKSDCRYEVDKGWLCDRCIAAIKSRGEPLTFRESLLDDLHGDKETVDLEYDNLTITLQGPKKDVDVWDEVDYSNSFVYTVDKDDIASTIWERFITEEDVTDVPGGLKTLEDETAWSNFLASHFDILFNKYYKNILDYYEEDAIQAFSDSYTWNDYMSEY